MAEHEKPRPVSGEIMSAARGKDAPSPAGDFTDAEFETVARPAPEAPVRSARPATQAPPNGMESLRAVPVKERPAPFSQHGGPAFWLSGLIIVIAAFWVAGGHVLVRERVLETLPADAPGLAIRDVQSRVEPHGGGDILFVDGNVENDSQRDMEVPPLSILVASRSGPATTYFLGTNGTVLAPGERFPFSSRLQAPENGVSHVTVTFREEPR